WLEVEPVGTPAAVKVDHPPTISAAGSAAQTSRSDQPLRPAAQASRSGQPLRPAAQASRSDHEPQDGQHDDHGQRDGADVPARPPVGALLDRAGHDPSPGRATPSPARTQRISAATDSSIAPSGFITAAVWKKQVSLKLWCAERIRLPSPSSQRAHSATS